MSWKTERWLKDIFPGQEKIYSEYRELPRRELAIVAAGVLDAALAELIHNRLRDDAKESEDLLGVSGDSRAPCASFGARIQLAYLLRLITKDDLIILRFVKNIRNTLAHRVKADFNSKEVLPLVIGMQDQFADQSNRLIRAGVLKGSEHTKEIIRPLLSTTPEVGAALLLAVFTCYHAYLHRLSERVKRVDDCIDPNSSALPQTG